MTFLWFFLFSNLPTKLKVMRSSIYFLLVFEKLYLSKANGTYSTLEQPAFLKISQVYSEENNTL